MHILVTNDDGIDSPGLWALAGALQSSGLGRVSIVAPESEQSGTGMSLPMRIEHHIRAVPAPDPAHAEIAAFAFSGTPAGCVTAGMLTGLCPRPDAVVSGINRGLNSGTNVLLSGTVGAAMVAALWGLPAMAISLQFVGDAPMPWATAAWAATRLFPLLEGLRARGPLLLNVNVPHIHNIADLRGFRQTSVSEFFFGRCLDLPLEPEDDNGRRRVHFRFVRERIPDFPEASDDGAIRAGYVSLTPLSPVLGRDDVDLTAALAAAGLRAAAASAP
ncbi:MAG: 5'/3'-nucleotidase SurE [Chloroflexales bacterium]